MPSRSRVFFVLVLALATLVLAGAARAIVFPPAIAGFAYRACLERLPNTGVIAGEGIYVNSYVANGQASNMTMGGRADNYHCLVGSPTHYGNVRFTVNVFAMSGGVLAAPLASYVVEMQTLFPKFIVDGPSYGRVGSPFSTKVPIYSDPPSQLPWTATVAKGSLPPGLSVSGNGAIRGVPRRAGTFPFTLEYTTPLVPWQDAARPRFDVSLVVADRIGVRQTALPVGRHGARYVARLVGTHGLPPYTFVPLAGTLPRALTLSRTGIVRGVPRRAGTFTVRVLVTDAAGEQGRDTVLLRVRRR
jgi:hypothetical protein